jgi:hypothetical protein
MYTLRSMLKKHPLERPTIDEILEKDFVNERLHAQVCLPSAVC